LQALDTRAEVDLRAIVRNIKELKKLAAPGTRLMAAVKAEAYGHGLVPVADSAISSGADILGVARIEEAIRLRDAGIKAPVLILGYTDPGFTKELLDFNLTQSVFSKDMAEAYSKAAEGKDKKLAIHLKVDTGMGRLGFMHALPIDGEAIAGLPNIYVEGIFTHFAKADEEDKHFTKNQLEVFLDFVNALETHGIKAPIRHAANSAALIDMPESHLDMVRPGISIYGLYPSSQVNKEIVSLTPAMQLKSRIVQVKDVPKGYTVSYGGTWTAERKTRIATIPIGYGDGFSRSLSSRGQMLVCGQRAPIVGRVCMDLTMLDVGHIQEAVMGSEVVVLGKQGADEISADEIAGTIGTINYEIVTAITGRVPKVYLQ
jgi:alanine racemase